jgi:integrase/recombinase XerD
MLGELQHNTTLNGLRDYAIFYSLYFTGCRINELLSINRDDINNGKAQIIGKGGKLRTIFFEKSCLEVLNNYLSKRKDKSPFLFISNSNCSSGKKIEATYIRKKLKKILRKLNIEKKVTPHTFRHTYATLMMDAGCDIFIIQKLLGHSSIRSTQRYLHVADFKLKKNYEKFIFTPFIQKGKIKSRQISATPILGRFV